MAPCILSIMTTYIYLNHFCLDLHLEINDFIKSLSPLKKEDNPDIEHVTQAIFLNHLHVCWSVMESMCDVLAYVNVL